MGSSAPRTSGPAKVSAFVNMVLTGAIQLIPAVIMSFIGAAEVPLQNLYQILFPLTVRRFAALSYSAALVDNEDIKAGNLASYSDGSVENDLPMQQLSELFNVNHFIVSQVCDCVVRMSSADALLFRRSESSPPPSAPTLRLSAVAERCQQKVS